MTMPGRNYSSGEGYRFGFQGQETDDEVRGDGNSVFFKYRVHDPRIGRFASIDPLAPEYPWNSPYAFSENKVIQFMELEGLEVFDYRERLETNRPIQNAPNALTAISNIGNNTMSFVANALLVHPENAFRATVNEGYNLFTNDDGLSGFAQDKISELDEQVYSSQEYLTETPSKQILSDLNEIGENPATYEGLLATSLEIALLKKANLKRSPKVLDFHANKLLGVKNVLIRGAQTEFKGKLGVYVHKFKGGVYVGQATDLGNRPLRSLRELSDPTSSKYKNGPPLTEYIETEFYEFDPKKYKNLDHMEGDILNNTYKGPKNTRVYNKKQSDHWILYKDN